MRRESTIDDDGVSITTGYILNIGIATLVLSTLAIGLQGTFDNIEESTADAQAETVAQKVASEISQADRLARIQTTQSGLSVTGTVEFELRDSIADSGYSVNVSQDWVNVSTGDGEITSVRYNVSSDVNGTRMQGGGDKQIRYDSSSSPPEVTIFG